MSKDWTGNSVSTYINIGASNHTDKEREEYDYYATDSIAIDVLLDDGHAELTHKIWEPACGGVIYQKDLKNVDIKFIQQI